MRKFIKLVQIKVYLYWIRMKDKLKKFLSPIFSPTKKYLSKLLHKLKQKYLSVKGRILKIHNNADEKGVYKRLKEESANVVLNGIIIWMILAGLAYLTGFSKLANPLLIPCYGLIPWYISQLMRKDI